MARKRVEDTVPALESWDDVNQALATIADNQRTVENFEAAMQNKIDEAKAEAEAPSSSRPPSAWSARSRSSPRHTATTWTARRPRR